MYERIQTIKSALSTVTTLGPWFLNDVNDFPSVALRHRKKSFVNLSANERIAVMNFTIRGYVMSDEDSTDDCELLIRQIEAALESIRSEFVHLRILSIDTDSGLLSPYGVCEIECEASWYEC